MTGARARWYDGLTAYHWFVLMVAALGWLFDTMDQQLFTLARVPAMKELLAKSATEPATKEAVDFYGPLATAIFLIGWATGGLTFGVLGDRIGRARTMLWTILLYSLFTGLSAFSVGFWDFSFYRFLTGLGVGGEFAVGVALVAEVMPDSARPYALGLLQSLSAIGNVAAAVINMGLGQLEGSEALSKITLIGGVPTQPWRLMFVVGTLPALLAILIRRKLKEPEKWQQAHQTGELAKKSGSYAEMFRDPRWRHNAIVGMLLSFSGVVGLWGIGFFTPDLIGNVFTEHLIAQGLSPAEVGKSLSLWKGIGMILLNAGAFFGMASFSWITGHWGRRRTFALFFVMAMFATILVFWELDQFSEIFWMMPLLGFCQLGLFGGFAIYLPELFPTHLRSTGTSLCYNVGRFVAAIGVVTFGGLCSAVFSGLDREPMRYAGVTMSAIYLVGLCTLPFAETKGQPLPE